MMNISAEQTFRAKAPGIVARLMGDFPLLPIDGFAITGNSGHECLGYTKLQEMKPTVKGSRGGWGWMQWTGPRRRAFEAYCQRNKLDPTSDKANYAWLFIELSGSERKAVAKVKAASGLGGKVEAFELAFLRAGVKHYPSRLEWAKVAQDAWDKAGLQAQPTPVVEKMAALQDEAKVAGKRAENSGKGAVVSGGAGVTAQAGSQFADLLLMGVGAVILGLTAWLIWRAVQQGGTAKALQAAALKLEGGR